MEFFKIISLKSTAEQIQKNINFDHLDDLCESIFIQDHNKNIAQIGGIWGDFSLQKDLINGGVRFSLLECPNALTFTITTGYPPEPEQIVFHLTVNITELKPEFIDEIEEFINDWKTGIKKKFNS